MQRQYFEDYVIGSTRTSHGRTVTEADIVLHAGQTGDFYPHHMDKEFCAAQPFGQRIAHGTLIMSVGVGMLAGEINEVAMSYGYDGVRFLRPVYIGDTITATATIIAGREYKKDPDRFGLIDEKLEVVKHTGETALVLTHIYLVEKKPTDSPR